MRLAIVSGGSKGLGLALCVTLQEQGYQVIEFSRSAPHAYSFAVDLTDPVASQAIIRQALQPLAAQAWDEVLLISNAGMLSPIGMVGQQESAALLSNINANVSSAMLLIAEVVAQFQAHTARKVLASISSGAALRPKAGWSLYCAAKAAMESFVKTVALEQAAQAAPFIALNIDPGLIDTEMQAQIRAASQADFPDVAQFIARKKSGLLIAPERVAAAVMGICALPKLENGGRYAVMDYL